MEMPTFRATPIDEFNETVPLSSCAFLTLYPWIKPRDENAWQPESTQARKEYKTIGQHEIVPKWSIDLTEQIVGLLEASAWNYFFPIRIGIHGNPPHDAYPLVLLIAIEKDSLCWEEAITIGLACRHLLREHGVWDVEVEIQEARRCDLAASAELEALVESTTGYNRATTIGYLSPLLPYPGHSITYLGKQPGEGTLGLYVRLEGDDSIYGLTCGHVVAGNQPSEAPYRFGPESQPQYHAQGSMGTFDDCVDKIETLNQGYQLEISRLSAKKQRWDEFYCLDEDKQHLCPTEVELDRLDAYEKDFADNEGVIDVLRGMEDKSDRRIGQLSFRSAIELSRRRKGYLKDWALIEFDREKFHRPQRTLYTSGKMLRNPVMDQQSAPLTID
ncbi:hypothetical protein GGS26DRAFT_555195 [Hypomontagnella submonticulosa]|nr:hypothetical protein GGS26DRAFT_555195 [Hypomontagnella submonticulosa]